MSMQTAIPGGQGTLPPIHLHGRGYIHGLVWGLSRSAQVMILVIAGIPAKAESQSRLVSKIPSLPSLSHRTWTKFSLRWGGLSELRGASSNGEMAKCATVTPAVASVACL